jgi:hypothetical protein
MLNRKFIRALLKRKEILKENVNRKKWEKFLCFLANKAGVRNKHPRMFEIILRLNLQNCFSLKTFFELFRNFEK